MVVCFQINSSPGTHRYKQGETNKKTHKRKPLHSTKLKDGEVSKFSIVSKATKASRFHAGNRHGQAGGNPQAWKGQQRQR